MMSPVRFSHALVRSPGTSVVDGLRVGDGPDPDPAAFLAEHQGYVAALEASGVKVVDLGVLDQFPDSVFVEDAALCIGDLAVALRPGAPTRAGEADVMIDDLAPWFGSVNRLSSGSVDGGDVLVTGREVMVGRSNRTDVAGIEALADALDLIALPVRLVETPPGVLHFKTDCAVLDDEVIFATQRLADSGCFSDYRVIVTPPGEDAAANLIRVNDAVLVRTGFPETAHLLEQEGFDVVLVAADQAARVDGGLSCMSLRCVPPLSGAQTA